MSDKKTKNEKRVEKDLLKIIGFFALLVVIFLIASSIFKSFNQFDYEGLTFTKEKFDDIPVFHYYYFFKTDSGDLIKYNLYLRNDPRENNISVEGDKISLSSQKTTYITMDATELGKCERSILAIGTLSGFLTDNQMKIKSGTTDIVEASVYGDDYIRDYITCENKPSNVVVVFESGEETKISIEGKCHKIIIGPECRTLEAVEKYNLQTIFDAR